MGLLDHLSNAPILGHVPGGNVLEPVKRRERKPMLRCDRCGCWAPMGHEGRMCPICTGGRVPQLQGKLPEVGSQLPGSAVG